MNEKDERLLTALIDGEADDGERRGLLGPVDATATLSASLLKRHAVLRALSDAMRARVRRHRAPRRLSALPARPVQERGFEREGRERAGSRNRWNLRLAGAMTSTALVSVVATALVLNLARSDAGERLLVSAHLRSMMSPHAVDVASSDSHAVKPWFSGRLRYAPPVEDFAAQGFTLVGGRLEVFEEEAVAALVYRRKEHLINLYVLPTKQAGRLAPHGDARHNGFNIAARRDGEFTYIAVSDLNTTELNEFLKLATAPHG
ncbi:MAG: anti-sigma factor [Betaproteobacteria bacterium]|nr:MAG: anti-sigma factor [Betaproteobacteria bacterium]